MGRATRPIRSGTTLPARAFAGIAAAVVLAATAHAAADAPEPVRIHAIVVRGDRALVARDRGVDLVEIRTSGEDDSTEPYDVVGAIGLRTSVYDALWWTDDLAWVAGGSNGVILLDLTDETAPVATHRIETRGSCRRLARAGSVLYVADDLGGLVVVDAERPARARIRRTVPSRSQVRSVSVEGERLVTAEGSAGVRVFDLERPDAPREIARIEPRRSVSAVALAGDLLIVGAGSAGFTVYRDAGGGRFRPSTESVDGGRVADVLVRDDRVFVSSGSAGLRVYRLAENGDTLVWVSEVRLPRSFPAGRVAVVSPERILVAAGAGGVADVDLSDPGAPEVVHPRESTFRIRWRP